MWRLKPELSVLSDNDGWSPSLYVHGNHDDKYNVKPPEGCICIEDEIYEYEGVRFLGLGGSNRYKPGKISILRRR